MKYQPPVSASTRNSTVPAFLISGGLGQRNGGFGERRSDGRSERNGRRHFHNFLIAALHRAIAFVEVQDVAVIIRQDLDLDVARAA